VQPTIERVDAARRQQKKDTSRRRALDELIVRFVSQQSRPR
jgi:hypothetical protein